MPYIDPKTLDLMQQRTDWGDLIEGSHSAADE
jgi:hypothetical protein